MVGVLCQYFRNEKGPLMRARETLCSRKFVCRDYVSLSLKIRSQMNQYLRWKDFKVLKIFFLERFNRF